VFVTTGVCNEKYPACSAQSTIGAAAAGGPLGPLAWVLPHPCCAAISMALRNAACCTSSLPFRLLHWLVAMRGQQNVCRDRRVVAGRVKQGNSQWQVAWLKQRVRATRKPVGAGWHGSYQDTQCDLEIKAPRSAATTQHAHRMQLPQHPMTATPSCQYCLTLERAGPPALSPALPCPATHPIPSHQLPWPAANRSIWPAHPPGTAADLTQQLACPAVPPAQQPAGPPTHPCLRGSAPPGQAAQTQSPVLGRAGQDLQNREGQSFKGGRGRGRVGGWAGEGGEGSQGEGGGQAPACAAGCMLRLPAPSPHLSAHT